MFLFVHWEEREEEEKKEVIIFPKQFHFYAQKCF